MNEKVIPSRNEIAPVFGICYHLTEKAYRELPGIILDHIYHDEQPPFFLSGMNSSENR